MKKRILAMFLACMMILSVIAVPAFAAEEECAHKNATYASLEEGKVPPEKCTDAPVVCSWECPDCGASGYKRVVGEHKLEVVVIDPTCTEPQKVGEVCKNEGCNYKGETTAIPGTEPLGHDWVVDTESDDYKAADCENDGVSPYKCSRCPATKAAETVPAHGHDWKYVKLVDADCENAAGMLYECVADGCDETKVEPFTDEDLKEDAKGHTPKALPDVEATCKTAGRTGAVECEICHKILDEGEEVPVDATKHTPVLNEAAILKDANCTQTGVGKYKCEDCDADLGYKVIPIKHVWDAGTYLEGDAPTCGKAGTLTKKCTVGECKATLPVPVPATGEHTRVDAKDFPETCDSPATVKKNYCTTCGDFDSEEVVEGSKKLGHLLSTITTGFKGAKEPTCTEPGTGYIECTREGCDYAEGSAKKPITLEALGHDYTGVKGKDYPASCTNAAGVGFKCTRCNNVKIEAYTDETLKQDKLDHEPKDADTNKAATCATKGWTGKKVCKHCETVLEPGHELPIDPDNHNIGLAEGEDAILRAPNCATGTAGVGLYKCKNPNCDLKPYYASIAPEHTWGTEDACEPGWTSVCVKCTAEGCNALKVIANVDEDVEDESVVGKIISNQKIAAELSVSAEVLKNNLKNSTLFTVVVTGVDAAYGDIWLDVNDGKATIYGHTFVDGVYTFICKVNTNNIADTFSFKVKSNTYGVICESDKVEYTFAQYEGTFTVEGEADKALEGATVQILNKGVFIDANAQLAFVTNGTSGMSIVLKKAGEVFATKAIDPDNSLVTFDLTAADWNTEFEIYVVDANGKVVSDTIYYSVAEYAAKKLAETDPDEALLRAVLSAMMQAVKADK